VVPRCATLASSHWSPHHTTAAANCCSVCGSSVLLVVASRRVQPHSVVGTYAYITRHVTEYHLRVTDRTFAARAHFYRHRFIFRMKFSPQKNAEYFSSSGNDILVQFLMRNACDSRIKNLQHSRFGIFSARLTSLDRAVVKATCAVRPSCRRATPKRLKVYKYDMHRAIAWCL